MPIPADIGMRGRRRFSWNGFYSPELNAHFFHTAGDSQDDGVIWVYRYQQQEEQ